MDPAWRPAAAVDTRADLSWTYHDDKFSCIRGAYTAHLVFDYAMFAAGVACMVTRVSPRLHAAHVWCGRAYVQVRVALAQQAVSGGACRMGCAGAQERGASRAT